MLNKQNPSMLYKLIDSWGNNRLFGFIYSRYIRQLSLRGNEQVLDFGSGSGAGARRLAKVLQKGSGRLTCNDISEYWMGVAKKRLHRFENVDFALGQLPELHLKQEYFDVVTVHYALHEVPADLRPTIVREFHRLLKPGGKVCVKEPKRENDGMSSAEIRALMVGAGFQEQKAKDEKQDFQGIFVKPGKA